MMLRWFLRMLLCFCTSSLLLAAAAAALLVAAASSGTAGLPADTCGKAAAAGGCARGKFLPQILLPRQSHTSASDEKLFFFAAGISCTSTVDNLILRRRGTSLFFNIWFLPRSTSTLSIFFFTAQPQEEDASSSSIMGASRGTLNCFFKAAISSLRSLFSSASRLTVSDCLLDAWRT